MTKRTIIPLLIAALVALLLPWLAVTFAKGDNGMAVIFLLFFAVNPIAAVLLGVFSGGNAEEPGTGLFPVGYRPVRGIRRTL